MKKVYYALSMMVLVCTMLLPRAHAEGTKQMTTTSSATNIELEINRNSQGATGSLFGGWTATSVNDRIFIHINDYTTEKIYCGFQRYTSQNVYYRIKRPDGTVVAGPTLIPTSGTGYISSWNKANIGPNALTGNSTGYSPFTLDLNANSNTHYNGDYYIEFNEGTTANDNQVDLVYYDITVANGSANTSVQEGRLWSYNWGFTSNAFTYPSGSCYGSLYVYTTDSIVTEVDLNGLSPYRFRIYANSTGPRNDSSLTFNRKSIDYGSNAPNEVPEFKVFLSNPDLTAYPSAIGANRTATFNSLKGCPGNFCFNITVNGNALAELRLDINNNNSYNDPIDRLLEANVVGGVNCIQWDGKDGLGNNVANNTTFKLDMSTKVGTLHIPIYDAEENKYGYLAAITRPSGVGSMTVYYDDSQISGGGSDLNGIPAAAPQSGMSVNTTGGAHTWNDPFGDTKTLNTWFTTKKQVIANYSVTLTRFDAKLDSTKNVNCKGAATGKAYVSATFGTTPYTYSWNTTPAQTTASVTNLAAGSYICTVTDAIGCSKAINVTITEPSAALSATCSNVSPTAYGMTNGTASVVAAGGTSPYTYAWNGGGTASSKTNLGSGSYSVTVTDSKGCTASCTTTMNNFPLANYDVISTPENVAKSGNIAGNDTLSADGGNAWSIVSNPSHGTVTITAGTGAYTYTPSANYSGTDQFVYKLCDVNNDCDTAIVYVTVTSVNHAPVANKDSATTNGNTALNASVTANDSDPDGNINPNSYTTTCATCTTTSNGTLVLNANGSYTYTPNAGFTGVDQFVYQVCDLGTPALCDTAVVKIKVVNRPPVANKDSASSNVNTLLNASVTANDSDPDGNINPNSYTTTCATCTTTSNGTLVLNANGTYTYTPNTGFTGVDQFVYQVCDLASTSLCDTAVVKISVNNRPPVANKDSATTNGNTLLNASVTANDSDPDGNINPNSYTTTCATCTTTSNGTLVLNANGSYSYTPNAGFTGVDQFVYQVCDLASTSLCDTAVVKIKVVNRPPVANKDSANTNGNTLLNASVTANDSDPDGNINPNSYTTTCATCTTTSNGTLVLNANGSYSYTPNAGFTGVDQFVYQVCDLASPSLCDTAVVKISVTNRPPAATYDNISTPANTPANGSVSGNDTDPDGNLNPNSFTIGCATCSNVSHGSLVFNNNGTFTYTPNTNFYGNDSFVYQVCDAGNPALCDTAVVYLNVTGTPVTPSVSINTPNTTVCAGTSVTFTATPTHGGSAPSYQWKINGNNVGTNSATYTNATFSNNDTVWVVMTSNAPLAIPATATSGKVILTVNALPTQPSAFTVSSSTIYWGQNPITYTVPNTTGVTYNWSYSGTGVTINGSGNSVTLSPAQGSTSGNLSVTASNGCGTSTARTMPIVVKPFITWLCSTNSDWNTGSNWDAGFAPYSTINVVIPASSCQSQVTTNTSVNNMTVQPGASVNVACSTTISVKDSLKLYGDIVGCGNTILNGTHPQTLDGNGKISNLELNNPNGATIKPGDTIHISSYYKPTDGVLNTNNGLELLSDSTKTATIGPSNICNYINGNVIVNKYIHGNRRAFRFFGHPFTSAIGLDQLTPWIDITGQNGAQNGFTNTITNNPSAFWYNTATGNGSALNDSTGWIPFTNTNGQGVNAWNPMQGARILVRGAKGEGLQSCCNYTPSPVTIKMHGPVNQCNTTYNASTNTNMGYNFIGNPYASNVDMSLITIGSGLNNNFSVWDPNQGTAGAYISQPFAFSYILPAYSAFIVRAGATGANNVTFTESSKSTGTPANLFKTTSGFGSDVMQLRITSDNGTKSWDRVLLFFNNQSAATTDATLDAEKMSNPNLDFYTYAADNKKLAVDVRPYTQQTIKLGLETDQEKAFTISVEDLNISNGGSVYLFDKYLNTNTLLSQNTTYNFTVSNDPNSKGDRFELNATAGTTSIQDANGDIHTSLYPNPAKDEINYSFKAVRAEKTTIQIVSITGQQMYAQDLGIVKEGNITISLDKIPSGLYYANIKYGNQTITRKFVKQ